MSKKREHLLSLTKNDFEVQTFRCGGPGGQHQNKTESGVRIVHRESGAVGEGRDNKSQHANKRLAFKRLTSSTKFKTWINRKSWEIIQGQTLEEKVEKMMDPKNLKIEVRDENGKWTEDQTGISE